MTAPDFTIADKLREARALVERGWTQGSFHAVDGKCCAYGALMDVSPLRDIDPLQDALGAAIGVRGAYKLWDWNDAPERTQAEVLAAFDRAIELASPSQ